MKNVSKKKNQKNKKFYGEFKRLIENIDNEKYGYAEET